MEAKDLADQNQPLQDLSTVFYDIMFNNPLDQSESLNELESKVMLKIKGLVQGDVDIDPYIPPQPKHLNDLVACVKSDDADFARISDIIHQDASLAGAIVEQSNSAYFRRTPEPITSIESAVRLLGLSEVSMIAMTILSKQTMKVKPIYFKFFGKQIWDHSLACAAACRALAEDDAAAECYFLGLIHDVGKIIVFRCLLEEMAQVDPSIKPGGKAFKKLMTTSSLCLSEFVAIKWSLEDNVVLALRQQRTPEKTDYGQVLHAANLCSELHLLEQKGYADHEESVACLQQHGLDEATIQKAYDAFASLQEK